MKDLLLLEWKKFGSNTVVRVLLAIYVLLACFVILLGGDVFKDMPPPFPSSADFYEFPSVWDYQGYVVNWMASLCLGFLIIYIVTSEVSYKTQRQNIINGLTRQQYFLGKSLIILVLASGATILYFLSTIIIGILYTDGWDIGLVFDNNLAILRIFLMCIGYMSFALLLGFWLRRGTLALLLYFFYVIMLEPIVMAIHVYYFKNSTRNYYPMNAIEDLNPFPLFKLPDYYINKEWNFELLLPYSHAIVAAIIYSSLFIFLAYRLFTKRDI